MKNVKPQMPKASGETQALGGRDSDRCSPVVVADVLLRQEPDEEEEEDENDDNGKANNDDDQDENDEGYSERSAAFGCFRNVTNHLSSLWPIGGQYCCKTPMEKTLEELARYPEVTLTFRKMIRTLLSPCPSNSSTQKPGDHYKSSIPMANPFVPRLWLKTATRRAQRRRGELRE